MIRRHITVRVTLDDGLSVTTDVAPGGVPIYVVVEEDGGAHQWEAGAGEVERIAAYLRDVRWRAGDFRSVCPDHGLHGGVSCKSCEVKSSPAVADEDAAQ